MVLAYHIHPLPKEHLGRQHDSILFSDVIPELYNQYLRDQFLQGLFLQQPLEEMYHW